MISETAIADAVCLYIQAANIVPAEGVEVAFVPRRSEAELQARPCVTIVPRAEAEERKARHVWEHDYQIDVAIQRYVKAEQAGEKGDGLDQGLIRETLETGRKLRELLKQADRRFAGTVLMRLEIDSIWDAKHLAEKSVLTGVFTATFRADDDYTDLP